MLLNTKYYATMYYTLLEDKVIFVKEKRCLAKQRL